MCKESFVFYFCVSSSESAGRAQDCTRTVGASDKAKYCMGIFKGGGLAKAIFSKQIFRPNRDWPKTEEEKKSSAKKEAEELTGWASLPPRFFSFAQRSLAL